MGLMGARSSGPLHPNYFSSYNWFQQLMIDIYINKVITIHNLPIYNYWPECGGPDRKTMRSPYIYAQQHSHDLMLPSQIKILHLTTRSSSIESHMIELKTTSTPVYLTFRPPTTCYGFCLERTIVSSWQLR